MVVLGFYPAYETRTSGHQRYEHHGVCPYAGQILQVSDYSGGRVNSVLTYWSPVEIPCPCKRIPTLHKAGTTFFPTSILFKLFSSTLNGAAITFHISVCLSRSFFELSGSTLKGAAVTFHSSVYLSSFLFELSSSTLNGAEITFHQLILPVLFHA